MSTHQALLSFNNGEGSPLLARRIDFDKTGSTCEALRNFLPLAFGGVTKRPGLVDLTGTYIAGLNSKAFPFTASDGTHYIIHFTAANEGNPEVESKIRIYRKDGTLADELDFFPCYVWPDPFTWENSLRDLQMENVNDVAFFTHPKLHPFRLTRQADGTWTKPFVEWTAAPMLDENLDENKIFTVVSNPIADVWASGTSYSRAETVFSGLCEWSCIDPHTSSGASRPGVGADWRDYWTRKFYRTGHAVTILATDKSAPAAWVAHVPYQESDVVEYGAYHYICGIAGNLVAPTTPPVGMPYDWDVLPHGNNWYLCHQSGGYTLNDLQWYEGLLYVCDALNPGVGFPGDTGWDANWSVYSPYIYRGAWDVHTYSAGDEVSQSGRQYVCILDHVPDATNRPGSGVDWEDYWLETSLFLPGFDVSCVTPGTYWRVSPQRDEQDFQLEIKAVTGMDGRTSGWMAVDGGWNVNTYGIWSGTFQVQKSTDGGSTWETIRSYQSSDDRNVSDGGFEQSPVMMRIKFLSQSGTASSGDQRCVLIPESPFITGDALMTEYVDADEMRGHAMTGMLSGKTFRWAQGAFSEENGFPRAVTLHESRLCFAGTARNPVSLWISASGDFLNYEVGSEDDDALFETLPVGNQSPIRWLAAQRRLFVGTSLAEWVVGSETSDAPLTPSNYFVRGYTGTGSEKTQPVKCASGMLFPGRKGGRLYELQYTTETGYEATDLSRLAEHLTAQGILSMAWQQTREPGLWVVTREGALLHFAYSKADRVFAWSRHDTAGGLFRDVMVFPSDEGDDEVFFIVDRGEDSFLMRLPQHWMATMEAGETDADSYVDGDAGAPIVSELISLPIDMQADTGTTQARRKRAHKICLDLFESRGGEVWNRSQSSRQPIKGAEAAVTTGWTETIPDAGALDDMQLKIYHDEPYPFTLRAAVVRWQLNEP